MFMIKQLGLEDVSEWERFASSSRRASIFHTHEWEEILRLGCPSELPFYWGTWVDDHLSAIWPTCIVRSFGGKVLRSLPHSNTGEPLITEGIADGILSDSVLQIGDRTKKKGALHWSISACADSSVAVDLAKLCGFRVIPSQNCTFTVDTTLDSRLLWASLSKGKKWAVKKSKACGVDVKESDELSDLMEYFQIYKSTMLRHRRPCLMPEFFENVYRLLIRENKAKLFLAIRQGEIIAGIIILLHRKNAYWWSGASLKRSWESYPNDLLLWDAIEWAHNSAIRAIDLGPTPSDPDTGLNMFKRHFGARRADFVELRLPLNKIKDWPIVSLVNSYRGLASLGVIPSGVIKWLQRRFRFE